MRKSDDPLCPCVLTRTVQLIGCIGLEIMARLPSNSEKGTESASVSMARSHCDCLFQNLLAQKKVSKISVSDYMIV